MNSPNAPRDSLGEFTTAAPDALNRSTLDLLGGEPLEGSGFEEETPAAGFRFDWNVFHAQSKGGLQ